ncbi:hypothetical protein M407DRAFT_177397 [Tulasnella calospora MUT 4182]|uniref:Uncharacterized protein n=1 Tax=Tulasnella calospora MUT 4182 TaxID=1051891 RepID=A0A0C3MJ72_9AGAM|nr:hypothetical protein M407DRAFT_177397 [Tulasnella calospora MUT 4182]
MMAAKAAGKLRDNGWIIDEVSVAFAGDALRWYIELDEETRNDWWLLQRAIIQKYPPPPQRSWHGSDPSTPNIAPKYFYIRARLQDSDNLLYVGIKNGDVAVVSSRSEGVMVRHDRGTKELHAVHMLGRTDTGEKFEIRRSKGFYYYFASGPSFAAIEAALVQLLDAQGLPKGTNPVRDGDSFTSWNVTDENVLQAIPRDASRYYIRLFLDPDANAKQCIRAYVEDPSHWVGLDTSSLRFLTLKLEEI